MRILSLGLGLDRRVRAVAVFLALGALLNACTQDPDTLTRGQRAYGEQLGSRPAHQRLYRPLYPSDATPRLTVLGDFDTPRSYNGENWRHTGLDIVGRPGDRVIAVVPGEACADQDQINGRVVYLYPRLSPKRGEVQQLAFSMKGPDRFRVRIAYAHLRRTFGDFGECRRVEIGEPLGEIGNSGIASDAHLHFEIVALEPGKLPGELKLRGAINPLYLMRREADQPVGTITCYERDMAYRPNPGAPPASLNIVWPTEAC